MACPQGADVLRCLFRVLGLPCRPPLPPDPDTPTPWTTAHSRRTVNLVAFLYHGRYPSLAERLCGLSHEYVDPACARAVSYQYLNQQLVWRELSELLAAPLPLVDRRKAVLLYRVVLAPAFRALGGRIRAGIDSLRLGGAAKEGEGGVAPGSPGAGRGAGQEESSGARRGEDAHEAGGGSGRVLQIRLGGAEGGTGASGGWGGGGQGGRGDARDRAHGRGQSTGKCPECGEREISVPFQALPCAHVFCYFCLHGRCLQEPGYGCPQCGLAVEEMVRWRGAGGHGVE